MKKILALFGSIGLVASTATTVIACTTETNEITYLNYKDFEKYTKEDLYNEKNELENDLETFKKAGEEIGSKIQLKEGSSLPDIDTNIIKDLIEPLNTLYLYNAKLISYNIILWKKGWQDVNKIDNEIVVSELTESTKQMTIELLKEIINQTKINMNALELDKIVPMPGLNKDVFNYTIEMLNYFSTELDNA